MTTLSPIFLLLIWTSPVNGFYHHLSRSCRAVPSLFGASLEVAHPRSVRSTSVISEQGPWPAELLRASLTPRTPLMRWATLSHCVCVCLCLRLFGKGWTRSCQVSLQHTLGYSHFRAESWLVHLCFYKGENILLWNICHLDLLSSFPSSTCNIIVNELVFRPCLIVAYKW